LSFPSGSPSGDEMENWMEKFSWMWESKDMIMLAIGYEGVALESVASIRWMIE